ncbi:anthrone oxygenase family protein [Bosea sp. CS1GBMeth4]|uniref:anthrone oxygenase family protein n=1 Tax=Bosea sp. CS1GBMeth4 TaxID=1892849 RepID=UPI00164600E8|nr:anthrone oxygenase family protein [Bosea sp. CS1GBMeth4]
MLVAVQILAILLAALSMTAALGHALEMPGKLRLAREHYLAVQTIYYPGFTVAGGLGEIGTIPASAALALMLPPGSAASRLAWAACASALAVQALYWLVVHPVNRHWLKDSELDAASERFFNTGADDHTAGWTALRDRWERGHAIRAVFATLALVLLAAATASA